MFLHQTQTFFSKYTGLYIVAFFLIRIVSFTLREQLFVQGLISFALVLLLGILYFYSPKKAFFVIILEIFLGGYRLIFALFGLIIRTLFIYTFLALWAADAILVKKHYKKLLSTQKIAYIFLPFLALAILGITTGFFEGHTFRDVIGEFIPYSFLLLIFPAHQFIHPHTVSKEQRDYL